MVKEVLQCKNMKDYGALLKDYGLTGNPIDSWKMNFGDDAWWTIYKHLIYLAEKEIGRR